MEYIQEIKTFFDSPERKDAEEIFKERDLFREDKLLKQVLEGFPEMVYILNDHRQIIVWNSKSFRFHNDLDIQGQRFGEAINCIHNKIMEAGCVTSKFCAECGYAKAIKNTNQDNSKRVEECRITSNVNGIETSFDFLVETTPLIYKNKEYVICALKDIADEKRRKALEKIFFHDVLNTASAVKGFAELLTDVDDKNELDYLHGTILESSIQLLHEILSQRELRNAEEKTLQVNLESISVNQILKNAYNLYYKHHLTENKFLEMEKLESDAEINTDKFLLARSLGNLIKNALEATEKGGLVKISAAIKNNFIQFNVYNDKVIPDNIQLQIFQRSFSTKGGSGRGIGTYSVKLIIEQYLNGTIGFISNENVNTIFTITLPKQL